MEKDIENNNLGLKNRRLITGSMETEIILEAIRNTFESTINHGKNSFNWREVESNIPLNHLKDWYWFRVINFGRNAENEITNGPINTHPGSTAVDDTGDFIATIDPNITVTNQNFRYLELYITEKTKGILYRKY